MLDSLYQMALKLLNNLIIRVENVKIVPSYTQRYDGRHYVTFLNL